MTLASETKKASKPSKQCSLKSPTLVFQFILRFFGVPKSYISETLIKIDNRPQLPNRQESWHILTCVHPTIPRMKMAPCWKTLSPMPPTTLRASWPTSDQPQTRKRTKQQQALVPSSFLPVSFFTCGCSWQFLETQSSHITNATCIIPLNLTQAGFSDHPAEREPGVAAVYVHRSDGEETRQLCSRSGLFMCLIIWVCLKVRSPFLV